MLSYMLLTKLLFRFSCKCFMWIQLNVHIYIHYFENENLPFQLNPAECDCVWSLQVLTMCEDKSIHCEVSTAQHFLHIMLDLKRMCHFWKKKRIWSEEFIQGHIRQWDTIHRAVSPFGKGNMYLIICLNDVVGVVFVH